MIIRSPEIRKIISEKGKATRDRHSLMQAKTIKLKISQYNPKEVFDKLERLFLEAKWWYNDLLSRDIFNDNLKRDYAIVKYIDNDKVLQRRVQRGKKAPDFNRGDELPLCMSR